MTPKGLEVRSMNVAPGNRSATVEVANISAKKITAYSLAYDITYADGHHQKGERMVEYLQGIIFTGEGVFSPGETRQERFSFAQPAQSLTATVDVVIYMDQTAEIGNRAVFQTFLSDRNATAEMAKKASTILQDVLASNADLHPIQTAITKLQAVQLNDSAAMAQNPGLNQESGIGARQWNARRTRVHETLPCRENPTDAGNSAACAGEGTIMRTLVLAWLSCCWLSWWPAFLPAWHATRIDPVRALRE
jgi:hypothetical protein